MHTHIIYYAVYKDIIVYIGSGTPNRRYHVVSGTSHVYELNKLHFLEPNAVTVHTLKGFFSAEEALTEEKKLIVKFKPKYNSQYLEGYSGRLECNVKEIEVFKGVFTESENNVAKTPYGKILSGQVPSVQNAINYYLDPETDNEVLFNAFPKFKEWLDAGVTISEMNTVGRKREAIDQLSDSNRRLFNSKEDMLKALNLKIGGIYLKSDLKVKLQEYYDKRNIKLKAKASSISEYFEVKTTTNSKGNCFKIIKKL